MIKLQLINRICCSVLILCSLLLISLVGSASAATLFTISPATQHVDVGQNFTINVYIGPDVPISGGQFDLLFDSSLVQVTGISEGNLLNQEGASTIFNPGIINNSQGIVTDVYGAILGKSNVSSPGILANIDLVTLNRSGTCTFEISNAVISNSTGYSLPVNIINGVAAIGDTTIETGIRPESKSTISMLGIPKSATLDETTPWFLITVFSILYIIIIYLSYKFRNIFLFYKEEIKNRDKIDDLKKMVIGTGYPDEHFSPKYWIILVIILLIPLIGFIDMIGSPLNWITGILLELIFIIYLVLTIKHYKRITS
ncbi:MAG TPA: cohesin domain-containing protein [archaeon]|nr:cohesin domain-containing protein [archaeon]